MSNRWAQGMPYGTSAIPYIGENGNWWVNQEDTGVKAQGPQGPQGQRGEAGIGAPGPALQYEDLTEEQKLELVSHYTADMQAVKDSTITETNEMVTEAKAEMDATKASALAEAKTIAEATTAAIVNDAVEAAQAEIDASVATATTNINVAAANAENAKVKAEEAANSATATLTSMQNIKQETIDAASAAAAETASSTVDAAVSAAQEQINNNINTAKDIAVAAANNADASKIAANNSANAAAASATNAATSATSAEAAKTAAENAAASVSADTEAVRAAATLAESYAKGGTGTREGEDEDNAKYFYALCKAIAESNGSSYMGECLYAELPEDAPIGAIYRVIADEESGFGADLNDEATWAEFNSAIKNADTFDKMLEAYAIVFPKIYDAGSLFIKTASGWEPFTHELNNTLLASMHALGAAIAECGSVDSVIKQIGYPFFENVTHISNMITYPFVDGTKTEGTCTFTELLDEESNTGVVIVSKKSVAEDESNSDDYYEYVVAQLDTSEYNHAYTLYYSGGIITYVKVVNAADGSVIVPRTFREGFISFDPKGATVKVVLEVAKSAASTRDDSVGVIMSYESYNAENLKTVVTKLADVYSRLYNNIKTTVGHVVPDQSYNYIGAHYVCGDRQINNNCMFSVDDDGGINIYQPIADVSAAPNTFVLSEFKLFSGTYTLKVPYLTNTIWLSVVNADTDEIIADTRDNTLVEFNMNAYTNNVKVLLNVIAIIKIGPIQFHAGDFGLYRASKDTFKSVQEKFDDVNERLGKIPDMLSTLEEVDANTEAGKVADALTLKQVNRNLENMSCIPDYTNELTSITKVNASYTPSVNCAVVGQICYSIESGATGAPTIQIDGIQVVRSSVSNSNGDRTLCPVYVPVKAGSVITTGSAGTYQLKVYPM